MTLSRDPSCNPACRVCHYKDLEYPAQLALKQEWADKQLARWLPVLERIVPAPENERLAYRSKSWMRASFDGGTLSFGMTRAVRGPEGWDQEFVSWDTCPLHVDPIQKMLPKLREALVRHASGFVERALMGAWIGVPHLVLVSDARVAEDLESLRRIDWSQVLAPPFNRVWFHHNPQVGKRIFSHHEIELLAGPPMEGVHPIRAFRQVAQTLLVRARDHAVRALLADDPSMVLDLYCGTGDLSLLLPPQVGWVGIELAQEAVRHAATLRAEGTAVHEAFVGTVEHRLGDPKARSKIADSYALYLNPPRSGLSPEARERVLALVAEKAPTSVVYLSCSASSLARDLEAFEAAGYRVEALRSFDFFPQTEHFESLAVMRPSSRLP
jgi:23S rRNA (uracil1939-C5)-methyltransferase